MNVQIVTKKVYKQYFNKNNCLKIDFIFIFIFLIQNL